MLKRMWFILVVAVLLAATTAGSIALAAGEPSPSTELTPSSGSNPNAAPDALSEGRQYLREGIPTPLVDAQTEGWFMYLGKGKFITELGRVFYWQDGRFVNSDGTAMELPSSSKAHLNALGIFHQPDANDQARSATMRAESDRQSELPSSLSSLSSWSGRYLHVGKVTTSYGTVTGNQATISVHDRSAGYAEYYGIGMATQGYPGHTWQCGLEFCDVVGTSTTWVPTLHAIMDGVDIEESYTNYSFNTTPSSYVNMTLKMSVQSSYQVWFYLGSTRLTKSMGTNYVQWSQAALQYTHGESAYEIGSDSTMAPCYPNPANHHYGINNQRAIGGAWQLQTGSCAKDEYRRDWQNNTVTRPGSFPLTLWIVVPNYDWTARSSAS